MTYLCSHIGYRRLIFVARKFLIFFQWFLRKPPSAWPLRALTVLCFIDIECSKVDYKAIFMLSMFGILYIIASLQNFSYSFVIFGLSKTAQSTSTHFFFFRQLISRTVAWDVWAWDNLVSPFLADNQAIGLTNMKQNLHQTVFTNRYIHVYRPLVQNFGCFWLHIHARQKLIATAVGRFLLSSIAAANNKATSTWRFRCLVILWLHRK